VRRRRQDAEIRVGWEGHTETLRVSVPEGEPLPYQVGDELRVVGRASARVGADAIVRGAARYTADISLPGMLHARMFVSPHPKARILSIDLAPALALEGVVAACAITEQEVQGSDWVLYAGQPVAAVAAETEEIARDAARRVHVEWELQPFVTDMDEARRDGAPRVFAGRRANVRRTEDGGGGDLEAAFARAEVIVERTFRTQVQTHSPLEPHGVVVRWDADGGLTCWSSTQGTFAQREQLARHFGIPEGRVRVLAEFVGGGFGSKLSPGIWSIMAAVLARRAGRPVRLILDRAEEHLTAGNRPNSVQWVRAGADREGRIVAWHVRSRGTGGVGGGAEVHNPMIYRVGAWRHEHEEIHTNAGPAAAMRAPGHPQASFAIEAVMDELAERLGMDPLEFRMRNDPHPVRRAQYELGARRIGWDRRNRRPGEGDGAVRRGIGVAATRWGIWADARAEVRIAMHRDGSIEVFSGAQDIGTGTRTVLAVLAAEELGVGPDDITVRMGDTTLPYGPMSGGSVTASSLGPACRKAAVRLRRQLARVAERELGGRPEYRDGRFVRGGRAMTIREARRLVEDDTIEATATCGRPYRRLVDEIAGVQFAEVEVDTETGIVRPVRIVAIQDCGKVVSRRTAESQIIGGVIMGISYALYEERIMDHRFGRVLNADFLFYKIAGPCEMPEIEPILFEVVNAGNAVSMTGLGEPPTIPTAAAIANAVYNATGVRPVELPMTPRRMIEWMERA
jgi:xanthine dehydrogenase YagR molybdenum-binding subunit